jgi:hypothetical protein
VSLPASDSGTLVTVTHESETEDEGAGYVDGWTHFLGRLAAQLGAA